MPQWLTTIGLLWATACSPATELSPDADELRRAFNDSAGDVRMVLLLSPS